MSKIWTYGQNACPDTRHKIPDRVSMPDKRAVFWLGTVFAYRIVS